MHLRLSVLSFMLPVAVLKASPLDDLYRITNATSDTHVEYHRLDLSPGQEITSADLSGPGKITYFYWTTTATCILRTALELCTKVWCFASIGTTPPRPAYK